MRCISLWQPWASLWCSGRKVHETRHWPTSHRGWLAVHAAKKNVCSAIEKNAAVAEDGDVDAFLDLLRDEYGAHWAPDLPRGAIIGVVNIVDCVSTEKVIWAPAEFDDRLCGDFSEGRFAWRRSEFRLLPEPIPYKGRQGMFDVPDDLFPNLSTRV